jgi:cytoskeletal protein RodZ
MESLGTFLKYHREARGVALDDVAATTRVPLASLRSIEEDRLDDLPGEVFVRGFLRAYSRCIGLDPEDVVARLDRPAPKPTLPHIPPTDTDLRRRRITTPALLLVLILAFLLAALVLWRPFTESSYSANTPAPISGTSG